jgi:3-oxoacyl-[acyl-carrier protein] reductase
MDNPIESWPRAVYEEPYFLRGDDRQMFLYAADPSMLRDILLDKAEAFPKDWMFDRVTKPALGEGLLTAQGEHWRWQRRAAAPGFRPDTVAAMTPVMVAAAEAALQRWRDRGDGARLDIATEMTGITFQVILDTMLSGGDGIDVPAAARMITDYLETLGKITPADLMQWPTWTRVALAPRGYRAMVSLKAMVDRMVAARRKSPSREDLVNLLMQAKDPETGRQMDDVLLRDNLLTFIGAGHETTALALTWSLYLLGAHPPTAARVRAEIAAAEAIAPLDVLILCQGTVQYRRAEFEPEGWDRVMAVNLDSLMDCARKFRATLSDRKGVIIIVSSISGYTSNRGNPAYAASKAGAISLTKTLGEAWAREGIRVVGLAPGLVDTKLTKVTTEHPERLEGALRSIPLGRMGTPADMAGAALLLASPLAAYVVGHTLIVDGGLSL